MNGKNRYEEIFTNREKTRDGSLGDLTTKAKTSLHEDELLEFTPSQYIPEDILEKLSDVSSINKIFYSNHAVERLQERGLPFFHKVDFSNCHAGQIDHKKSFYNKHGGKLLKEDPYSVSIDKIKVTYDPVHSKPEIVSLNLRIRGVVGVGEDEEENKKRENQLDTVLVLDVKKGKRGDYIGILVTGWVKAGNDEPRRNNYAVESNYFDLINKMDHIYKISKKQERKTSLENNKKTENSAKRENIKQEKVNKETRNTFPNENKKLKEGDYKTPNGVSVTVKHIDKDLKNNRNKRKKYRSSGFGLYR